VRHLLTILGVAAFAVPAVAEPNPAEAERLFSTAQTVCQGDNGKLWGRTLCGPMMLVDYKDRTALTNLPDPKRTLQPKGRWFAGTLGEDTLIANTPTDWLGQRWTQIDAPIPDDQAHLQVLTAHELFHRIQGDLGLTRPEKGNRHLDTFDGRYLLQLEWRALADAVRGKDGAVADALAFRAERYRLFPKAEADEAALEIAEGVAEYTGVMVGLPTDAERRDFAVKDLSAFTGAPTFVRSFAYATGPAMGLLLDQRAPGWRQRLTGDASLYRLLAATVPATSTSLADRIRRYDDGALKASEIARETSRQQRLAGLRAKLVTGPVLTLPLAEMNIQFNPQTLVALDDLGTVYPTLRLVDAWGSLEVESGGALLHADGKIATVAVDGADPQHGVGAGWKLVLKPGWTIAKAERAGDLVVTRASK
jgi:hypothetical protein